jgi:hypothetical protein
MKIPDGPQLKAMATSGRIAAEDLIWKQGMAEWVQASSAKGLFSTASRKPSALPERETESEASVPPVSTASLMSRLDVLRKAHLDTRLTEALAKQPAVVGALIGLAYSLSSGSVWWNGLLGAALGWLVNQRAFDKAAKLRLEVSPLRFSAATFAGLVVFGQVLAFVGFGKPAIATLHSRLVERLGHMDDEKYAALLEAFKQRDPQAIGTLLAGVSPYKLFSSEEFRAMARPYTYTQLQRPLRPGITYWSSIDYKRLRPPEYGEADLLTADFLVTENRKRNYPDEDLTTEIKTIWFDRVRSRYYEIDRIVFPGPDNVEHTVQCYDGRITEVMARRDGGSYIIDKKLAADINFLHERTGSNRRVKAGESSSIVTKLYAVRFEEDGTFTIVKNP